MGPPSHRTGVTAPHLIGLLTRVSFVAVRVAARCPWTTSSESRRPSCVRRRRRRASSNAPGSTSSSTTASTATSRWSWPAPRPAPGSRRCSRRGRARQPYQVAWLQVEDGDSDPARFWSSLVAAIGRPRPHVADRVAPLVVGSQGDDRVVVPAIVNELVDDDERLDRRDRRLPPDRQRQRAPRRGTTHRPLPAGADARARRPGSTHRSASAGCASANRISEVRAEDLRFATGEASVAVGSGERNALADHCSTSCAHAPRGGPPAWCSPASRSNGPPIPRSSSRRSAATISSSSATSATSCSPTMAADDRQRLLETSVLDRLTGPLVDAVTGVVGRARVAERRPPTRTSSSSAWTAPASGSAITISSATCSLLEAQRTFPERIPELQRRAAAWFEIAARPRPCGRAPARRRRRRRGDGADARRRPGSARQRAGAHAAHPARSDRTAPRRPTRCARCCGAGASTSPVGTPRRSSGSTPRSPSRPTRSTG